MAPEGPKSGLLVIVELGADWPALAVADATATVRRVVVELEGEGPAAFAARVVSVARSLMPEVARLDLAILAVNERADETQRRARRAIGRALLYPRSRRGAELLVTATDEPSDRLRDALLALAGELGAVNGAPERVTVCFGARPEPPPISSPAAMLEAVERVA
jgi:hypothetical protein